VNSGRQRIRRAQVWVADGSAGAAHVSDPVGQRMSATYLNATVTVEFRLPRLSVVGRSERRGPGRWATNFNVQKSAGALWPANS